jgi:excisionase family DNA binding protein
MVGDGLKRARKAATATRKPRKPIPTLPGYLRAPEVAALLQVSKDTVHRLIQRGVVTPRRVEGTIYYQFSPEEVQVMREVLAGGDWVPGWPRPGRGVGKPVEKDETRKEGA